DEYMVEKDYLSESEKRQKEIDLQISKINLEDLKESIEKSISSFNDELELIKKELEVLEANRKYQEENLNYTKVRYEKGLVEKSQYNQAQISYLNALLQIENKKMNYITKLIDISKYSERSIEDILKEALVINWGD
ncbi:TolC family protein, partial [Thermosipho sp. (in: thermotogales)]